MTALAATIGQSFRRPRVAARQIFALELSLANAWMALALTAVLVVLLVELAFLLATPPASVDPASPEAVFMTLAGSPIRFAVLEAVSLAAFGLGVHQVGRLAGGRGSLANALVLVAWMQILLLALAVVLIVAAMVLPPVTVVLVIGLPFLMAWVLTQFIMELHGFTSPLRVFLGIVAGYAAVAFLLSLVLAVIGIGA